ncbi:MAG: FAD-dependent oxidoreductase, partial [Thermodesulfobacteriota bacterium]|nr:FAD-dependent oxidoreductase [Thermodesulfobacteriota bacterium]
MTITQGDLQPEFRREVAAMPGGELAGRCFDCGTCAGVCPVSEAEPGFDPRKILHMLKLGLKERLLKSETLWYCSHCDTCTFVCPQNIRFNNVVDVLREMALKQGYVDADAFEKWGTGPCKAACPAHISIQGFVGAVARGAYAEGLRLIKEEMPFPSACGRVCHHPCEAACNRGQVDEPVSIMRLKRFLADVDLAKEAAMYVPEKKAEKNKKVAVVGSGPAGLTVAYFLAVEGYSVTVFEKDSVPGGMMAVGIPEYRLPAAVLQAEIKAVESLGVAIRLNSPIGEDPTFEDLRKGYDAVFLGVGLPKSFKLNVPGED